MPAILVMTQVSQGAEGDHARSAKSRGMPHDRNPSPGELVRRVRERHHVTQKELAQRAHTAQSAISRIECDRISPTVDTLSGLLRALGEELTLEARAPGGRPVVLRARVLDSEESPQPAPDTARAG
jgi:transcriptional regulator with XRE-family HTH domain